MKTKTILMVLMMLTGLGHIKAATFNVSDVIDVVSPGGCNDEGGGVFTCPSLRDAIMEINLNNPGDDTINLPAGTYEISLLTMGEAIDAIIDDEGDLDITKTSGSVSIIGSGPDQTIISGGDNERVLHILGPNVVINLQDLTISHGNIPNDGDPGTLGRGAGIYSDGSSLTIDNCEIANNTSGDSSGGGIYARNTVLDIQHSLFTNNTATSGGGILISESVSGTIQNTTISGNTATQNGGGIFGGNENILISYSTITNNTGTFVGGISGSVRVKNTIASENTKTNPDQFFGGDISGEITSDGYNLFGIVADTQENVDTFFSLQNTDQYGFLDSPLLSHLSPLTTTNSPTSYHLPQTNSPALDAADPADCIVTDQRGETRPFNGRCDIGAVERSAICGNDNPEEDEACDDGQTNGSLDSTCTSLCTTKTQGSPDILCGNGQIDNPHEVCDNGSENGTEDNECTTSCQLSTGNNNGGGNGDDTTSGGCNLNKANNTHAHHYLLLALLMITCTAIRQNNKKRSN